MPTTLQQLRDATYNILNENQDSTTYPSSLVDTMINMAELKICNGAVKKYGNSETLQPGALPFLHKTKLYSTISNTGLTSATTVGATTLNVSDTTSFPTSGALWINQNIVTYTGKTPTTFTGCSNVDFAHPAGIAVSNLFSLPADYMNSIRVIYDKGFQLDYKDYRNVFLDAKGFKNNAYQYSYGYDYQTYNPMLRCYTIIEGIYLATVNIDANGMYLALQYNKKPTRMTSPTDVCTVPDEWSLSTIPYLAVADMFYNRGEEQRAMALNDNFGYNQVASMYDYYNKQYAENIFGTRLVSGKDGNFNI